MELDHRFPVIKSIEGKKVIYVHTTGDIKQFVIKLSDYYENNISDIYKVS